MPKQETSNKILRPECKAKSCHLTVADKPTERQFRNSGIRLNGITEILSGASPNSINELPAPSLRMIEMEKLTGIKMQALQANRL